MIIVVSRAHPMKPRLSGPITIGAILALALPMAACQPSPQELWEKAQAAGQSGDYAEAAIHLKNLLEQDPENANARAVLGATALALGDPVSAEKELRRAIDLAKKLGGDTIQSQLVLVEAMLMQGRFEEALTALGPIDSPGSTGARVLFLTGQAQEGLGRLPEAEANYRKAMATSPGDPAPAVATAAIAVMSGRGAEADVLLDKALLLDANNVPAMVLKGRRIFESRGATDAEAYFRQALSKAKTPADQSAVLVKLADVQLVREDMKGASESVTRLEAMAPRDIVTRYLRARIQAQSGDYASAILGLQRIMNNAPGFRPAERLLGTVHYLNGNLEQAAMHISRVIGEGGGDPFLGRVLAELRLQQDRPEQALQTLLPMIRQSPGGAFEQGLLALAGQASLQLGDTEAALAYFRRGGEQYPDNERFRLGEISARLASGDPVRARTMLEGMRASSSNPLAVDYLSVMTYLVERENAKAESLAVRLATENAEAPWAHLLLATVYSVAGNAVNARKEFDEVIKLDPANKEALINLARLDYQEGNPRSGEARLLRVIEDNAEDYRPKLLLAEAQLTERRFNEALEQARQAARLAPDLVVTLNLLGRAAAAAGRWDEARDSFTRITTLDPANARAWLNLARATVAAGQNAALPDSLMKALEIAPQDPAVLVTAGDLLMEMKQPAEATKFFENAFGRKPSGELAIRACRARLVVGPQDSCSLLNSWLSKNPGDVVVRLFVAALHQSRGEADQAVLAYELVLGGQPKQPVALNNLAWLYFEKGDPRALPTAERALEVQPKSAAVMDTLGWIQTHTGDKRRGLDHVSTAAKLLPGEPNIQYHLAFALAESGQIDSARRTLTAALVAFPSFQSRPEAEQLMRRLEGSRQGSGG